MPEKIIDIEKHFWSLVDIKEPKECWEWKAARNAYRMNYGTFSINRKPHRAHRVAYEFSFGPIPQGKLILHRCDNPPCCNPHHLYLGTHKDNSCDMVAKGRMSRACHSSPNRKAPPIFHGEEHPHSKLTRDKVQQIRELFKSGFRVADLARNYGVSWSLVKAVVTYQIWR